jgi:hypothetical protein
METSPSTNTTASKSAEKNPVQSRARGAAERRSVRRRERGESESSGLTEYQLSHAFKSDSV